MPNVNSANNTVYSRLDRRLEAAASWTERRAALLAGDGAAGWKGVRALTHPTLEELRTSEDHAPIFTDSDHPLETLRIALDLNAVELELVLLALAPHVEPRYGSLFAILHEDTERPWLTVRVAQHVIGFDEARRALLLRALEGRLLATGVLTRHPDPAPLGDRLSLAPELVVSLQGADVAPARAHGSGLDAPLLIVHGHGDRDEMVASLVAGPYLVVDDPTELRRSWRRCLAGGWSLVLQTDVDPSEVEALASLGGRILWSRDERAPLAVPHIQTEALDWAERRDLWITAGRSSGLVVPGPVAEELATRWRIPPSRVRRLTERARSLTELRALAESAGHQVVHHGQRVATERSFDDIVLRPSTREALERLVHFVRNRDRVAMERGLQRRFRLGRGPIALFSGTSGTGKTLAAEVVAHQLGRPLVTVDLSRLVSKWVGETEKNIDQVLREAEASGACLFFDEGDALFSARTDVSSANDRFANLEVGYLLQRIEAHDGLVILASNLSQSIDEAFLRRFQFHVEFPFPEPADRSAIWSLMLHGYDVDTTHVARHRLSGGNIRNAALKAIFLAEQRALPLDGPLLEEAVQLELLGLGRLSRLEGPESDRGALMRAFGETLRRHLERAVGQCFAKEVHLLHGSPTKEALAGKVPAVSVALFRTAAGRKGGLRLGYVLSAWSSRAEEEMELLGVVHDAAAALAPEPVRGRPVQCRLQESHDFELLHRFWSSHGHPVRAALVLDVEIA